MQKTNTSRVSKAMLGMYECVCIATHRIQFSKSKAGPFTEIRGCLEANCTSAPVQLQSGGSKGRASNPFVCLLLWEALLCFLSIQKDRILVNSAQSRTLSCKYASVFFLINTWVVRNKSIKFLFSVFFPHCTDVSTQLFRELMHII